MSSAYDKLTNVKLTEKNRKAVDKIVRNCTRPAKMAFQFDAGKKKMVKISRAVIANQAIEIGLKVMNTPNPQYK